MSRPITILGAGCTGPLLGRMLAARGEQVTIYERRADPRRTARETGRSINLALAARGLHALERAGLRAAIEPVLVPMRGRLVHAPDGSRTFLPYGQRPDELIYSVPRARLNDVLLDGAEAQGVKLHFGERCTSVDFERGQLAFTAADGGVREVPFSEERPVFGADGAGSVLRRALVDSGLATAQEDFLDHAYRELTILPDMDGRHRLEREALHIWPRGGYMLIALPNADGTFTVTLFLPRTGPGASFEALRTPAELTAFFAREFPDALALMPAVAKEFFAHPPGLMATLHVSRWHDGGRALLVGDAAHAIVPFHGQGMNCAFEDCVLLDELLYGTTPWSSAFADYDRRRRVDTEAIARMAIENYGEMRDRVLDANFQLQKELALDLERRHPTRFIPRYSMVTFHADIPYSEAERRGAVQQQILVSALAGRASLAEVDFGSVGRDVEAHLSPLLARSAGH
jgi:kynurenine 3-monooxygenase